MVDQSEKSETKSVHGSIYEMTRLVLLAGIGAISLAQEEINVFLDRLVERGEMAESDARKLVREVIDRREKLEKERRHQVVETRHKAQPAGVTRADIEALNARIADLTHQIEELRKQQSGKSG